MPSLRTWWLRSGSFALLKRSARMPALARLPCADGYERERALAAYRFVEPTGRCPPRHS